MERVVQQFRTFEQAAAAEREYYANLTASERLRIFEEILARGRGPNYDPQQRLARVYRIVKFERS